MTAAQNLFALSFATRPQAGEDEGNTFDRPTAYTGEQLLAEVADLARHPDNAHVESVEIRRIGRGGGGGGAVDDFQLVAINGNATCGFSFQHWTLGYDVVTCTIIDDHQVAARKLVELLNNSEVERIQMFW